MGKYPITYAQFQVFIDAPDGFCHDQWWEGLAADEKHRKRPGNQDWPIGDHPRENVSWYDAIAFCRWLSAKLDYEVRLPTELEWLCAAQGSDGRKYPWGNEFARKKCNTGNPISGQTTPVTKFPAGASPYGVLDMAGNVWEWCLDKLDGGIDLQGDAGRVVRGGSWMGNRNRVTILSRIGYAPGARVSDAGFRVVAADL